MSDEGRCANHDTYIDDDDKSLLIPEFCARGTIVLKMGGMF